MSFTWDPNEPKRRISLDLPVSLIERIERQAAILEMPRAFLIETAVLGLVRDFEAIDAECGLPPCPPCKNGAHRGCREIFSADHVPCGCACRTQEATSAGRA